MRQIRVHGQEKRYHHRLLGMNSRLDTLQAAILLAKIKIFRQEVEERKRIGQYYHDLLHQHVKTMQIASDNTCVYAQYTIEVPKREAVRQYLEKLTIPTAVHYPLTLNKQPIFADYQHHSFPVAENAAKVVMSLPMHPYLTTQEQDQIANHLLDALRHN